MTFRYFVLLSLLPLCLGSCKEENEDVTSTVSHNGSVETHIAVNHIDGQHDELVTTHRVWVRDAVYKESVYRDTLPALGPSMTTAENEDGDERDVMVNKEYEVYITVK